MKYTNNRWSVRIEVGNVVTYHLARGGHGTGTVAKIEKEAGRGVVLTMVDCMTCGADDVTTVHLKVTDAPCKPANYPSACVIQCPHGKGFNCGKCWPSAH